MYYNNCFHLGDHDGPVERNGATVTCSEFSKTFREIDGVCNDLGKPTMGSVDGFVGRNTDPIVHDGTAYDLMDPNPREVSLSLFTKGPEGEIKAGFLNTMASAWINFFVHDLVDHGMPANGPGNIYVPIIKNHPEGMHNMVFKHLHPAQESPSHCKNVGVVDLQVIDLIRDRERHVPRYNAFRQAIHLPRLSKWSDITSNTDIQKRLEDVYDGDIDKVDLLTGTLAEDKFPGFGFSPTIFHLFVLMASRRIQSDRFYTKDFTPEVYTPEGLEWVSTRGFQDIMAEYIGKNPINPDGTDSKDFWSTANPFYLHGSVPGRPASHCLDGVANFGEFGIDCGGACPRCGIFTFFGVIIKMALKFSIVLAPILVVLLLGRSSKGKAKTA